MAPFGMHVAAAKQVTLELDHSTIVYLRDGGGVAHGEDGAVGANHAQVVICHDGPEVRLRAPQLVLRTEYALRMDGVNRKRKAGATQ